MFQVFLDFLKGGPGYNLATLIMTSIGIIFIPLTIYLALIAIKNKKPRYLIRNTNLVRDGVQSVEEVSVMYESKRVPNLSVARIVFWNAGRETIDAADVVEKDSIRVSARHGVEILSIKVLTQNEPTNNFIVVLNAKKRHASVVFDFIDKGQGVVLQIFHTGVSADDIVFSGRIKGCGVVVKIDERPFLLRVLQFIHFQNPLNKRKQRFIYGLSMLSATIIVWFLVLTKKQGEVYADPKANYLLLFIITILYLPTGLSFLIERTPRGLHSFYDEFS